MTAPLPRADPQWDRRPLESPADHVRRLQGLLTQLTLRHERFSFCKKHENPGGHYASCLCCAGALFSRALGAIDQLLEPDAQVTTYDLDCDPAGVVERVRARLNPTPKHPK